MAVKTLAALKQDTIADLKDSCTNAQGRLDVEKYVRWGNELVQVINKRITKRVENDQRDVQSFLNDQAAAFRAHREAKEAERIANGDPEE
jgi:hypothetical protein